MTGISRERRTVACKCAKCGTEAEATTLDVDIAGMAAARWVVVPAGWWVLLGAGELHARCPACLK